MFATGRGGAEPQSLPVWEEWIEIGTGEIASVIQPGLFPYGKSGLKLSAAGHILRERPVSSRMGRVD